MPPIDMGFIISLIMMAVGLWVVFSIPSDYLHGYADWVREQHGAAMNVSFGMLLFAVGIALALTLEKPGKYPMMELMVMLLIPMAIAVVAWDNYRFWRDAYRQRN